MYRITLAALVAIALTVSLESRSSADITTGLVAHWELDESAGTPVAVDSSGNGYDGDVFGSILQGEPGKNGTAYSYQGENTEEDHKRVIAQNGIGLAELGFNNATQPFSMFAWINFEEGAPNQRHVITGNVPGLAGRWNLDVSTSGSLHWFVDNTAANDTVTRISQTRALSTGRLDDEQWHLIGVSRDASQNYSLYTDLEVHDIGFADTTFAVANPISLGGRSPDAATAFGIANGLLDDVRIFDRVLPAEDIGELFGLVPPPPGTTQWFSGGSADWNEDESWIGVAPNGNTEGAFFGAVPTAANLVVVVDSPVSVKTVGFHNSLSHYIIAGTATVTLDADSGSASLNSTLEGSHEFQAAVTMADNLDVNLIANSQVDFNNTLNFGGNTLTKSGAGRLNINNQNGSAGTVNVTAGSLGGTGKVATLNNQSGGTVAPGKSAGTLTVSGNYTQSAGATLAVELGGTTAGLFDVLSVTGTANLMGAIDISLIDGFAPSPGSTYDVVTAGSLSQSGLTLSGLSTGWSVSQAGNNLRLSFAGGNPGDFNLDGTVDGADFLAWQRYPSVGSLADWQNNYGTTYPISATSAAVPEPSSLILLTVISAAAFSRRRRYPC